jgi:NusA-like KH domain protein
VSKSNRVLATRDIQNIITFESACGVKVVDSFEFEDSLVFLIENKKLGLVIGKNGVNIKRICRLFRKKIYVYEDCDDIKEFIQKLCAPYKATINTKELCIVLPKHSKMDFTAKRIHIIKELISRKFGITNIRFRW